MSSLHSREFCQCTKSSFTFWGYLDQRWIDKKIEEYNIDSYEIVERLEDFGYEAKQILNSPNPVILVIVELIIDDLIESIDDSYDISFGLKDQIREKLQETVFINCLDSHLDSSYVYEQFEEEIKEEFENLQTLQINEIETTLGKLKELFEEYDF